MHCQTSSSVPVGSPRFSTSWWPINHLEPQTEKENPHKNIPLTFPGCHAIQRVVLPRSLLARTNLTRAFVQVGRVFTDLPLALLSCISAVAERTTSFLFFSPQIQDRVHLENETPRWCLYNNEKLGVVHETSIQYSKNLMENQFQWEELAWVSVTHYT